MRDTTGSTPPNTAITLSEVRTDEALKNMRRPRQAACPSPGHRTGFLRTQPETPRRKSSVDPDAENKGFASATSRTRGTCQRSARTTARAPRTKTPQAIAAPATEASAADGPPPWSKRAPRQRTPSAPPDGTNRTRLGDADPVADHDRQPQNDPMIAMPIATFGS